MPQTPRVLDRSMQECAHTLHSRSRARWPTCGYSKWTADVHQLRGYRGVADGSEVAHSSTHLAVVKGSVSCDPSGRVLAGQIGKGWRPATEIRVIRSNKQRSELLIMLRGGRNGGTIGRMTVKGRRLRKSDALNLRGFSLAFWATAGGEFARCRSWTERSSPYRGGSRFGHNSGLV